MWLLSIWVQTWAQVSSQYIFPLDFSLWHQPLSHTQALAQAEWMLTESGIAQEVRSTVVTVSVTSGSGWWETLARLALVAQDLNFNLYLTISCPGICKGFSQGLSRSSLSAPVFVYSPSTLPFPSMYVVGKRLAEWRRLVFCFVLTCFVQRLCFFLTNCLQGSERRDPNPMK